MTVHAALRARLSKPNNDRASETEDARHLLDLVTLLATRLIISLVSTDCIDPEVSVVFRPKCSIAAMSEKAPDVLTQVEDLIVDVHFLHGVTVTPLIRGGIVVFVCVIQ